MKPNYVATKSAAAVLSPWLILLFWLIVPLIMQIVRILRAKSYQIEFYDNKMVVKSGLLNKNERQSVFTGVYAVSVSQSLWGRICGYGNISVDCPGKWDIDTTGIKDPKALKAFLEKYITTKGTTNVIYN